MVCERILCMFKHEEADGESVQDEIVIPEESVSDEILNHEENLQGT